MPLLLTLMPTVCPFIAVSADTDFTNGGVTELSLAHTLFNSSISNASKD